MNSAKHSTLIMLVLAAVSAAGAMYYYPWAEITVVDAEVGKPLFEEYSADQVRGIDIIDFNRENGTLDRIQLARRAEKWVVPARQNFVATNSPLIGTVVNSLNDRTVYEVISENLEDHIKFGVVDPTEVTADQNVASLGRKLVLTDRNRKSIASLIVGSQVKNDTSKRYVRVPGKPRVYLIDFDDQILTTQFALWVSPNALQLQTQADGPGQRIRVVQIDNYQVDKKDGATRKKPLYRASLQSISNQLKVSLFVPASNQSEQWKKLTGITPEQETKLKSSIPWLYRLLIDDVRRKKKALGNALKKPEKDTANDVFADLSGYGFSKPKFDQGRWTFESENGQVSVTSESGVLTTISMGAVGATNSLGKGKLNHFVMINSGVDYSRLKEPVRPPNLKDDDSDENKQFRRAVEGWKAAVQKAQRLATDLNAIHGDWFYLISEDVIKNLRPEIPLPTMSENESKPAENESESPQNKSDVPPEGGAKESSADGNNDK